MFVYIYNYIYIIYMYISVKIAAPWGFVPSTSCTGVYFAITMLQYYICLGIVLTVILVLRLGFAFGIMLY